MNATEMENEFMERLRSADTLGTLAELTAEYSDRLRGFGNEDDAFWEAFDATWERLGVGRPWVDDGASA